MTSVVMPLSGAFGGASGVFAVSGIFFALKAFIGGFISFKYLAYHIPGIFAALYWTTRSSVIRLFLPIACMAAFIVHPVGAQAWTYSLYWLIPVILYFMKKNHLFFEALGSTFVAHAVGSVIWMYAAPMTPAVWLALIPIVALERLVFASGMVITHHSIHYAFEYTKARFSHYALLFKSIKS